VVWHYGDEITLSVDEAVTRAHPAPTSGTATHPARGAHIGRARGTPVVMMTVAPLSPLPS